MTVGRHLLCFGLGYSASVLARRLAASGWSISGTSRTTDGASHITATGWRGDVFDGAAPSPAVLDALSTATHVLSSVPPDNGGDPVLRWHRSAIVAAPRLSWIGYFSTVGVYGDREGNTVDEATPPIPVTDRAKRRLQAETEWRDLGRTAGKRVFVFRLPGIYGPGRSAIDALRAGCARRIIKPGQIFNRIHVDDIAKVVETVIEKLPQQSLFNVTDDEPSPPEDVIAFGAELLGIPVPPAIPFDEAELSIMARSFYGESKRVSNARIRHDLSIQLTYPTYREGLAAIASSL